jgi:hypothetical protein
MSDLRPALYVQPLRRRFVVIGVALVLAAVGTTASAALSGDPAADAGWVLSSNSLTNGYYIQGNANFGFNLYSSAFAADSSLASTIGAGWSAGDTILALGGKRAATNGIAAGWGTSFTGAAVNSNLTSSARIVTKFGTSTANNVTPSTVRPDAGNGLGSFSGGNLGAGAILLGTPNSGGFFTAGNQGTFLSFLTNQRYDGANVSNIATDFGRIIYKLAGDGLLDSWEVVLNTTLLANSFSGVPTVGQRSVITTQRGAGAVTDTMISIAAVPEASSIILGCLATGVVGLAVAGRRYA